MRILTRYILREVISHAAIGVAVFTFVLFTRDLGHILDLVVRNSAPLHSVLELFLYTRPVAFPSSIPRGVLVVSPTGRSRPAAAGAYPRDRSRPHRQPSHPAHTRGGTLRGIHARLQERTERRHSRLLVRRCRAPGR